MKEYYLSELLQIKNGRDYKHLSKGPYPVYGSGGLMQYVDDYLYDKPSILLPRKGSLSNIQYADTPFWTVDTLYFTEVDESKADAYYLYYYLKLLDLSNLDSGTGVPSMTFDSYYNIRVFLPELSEQNRVSALLRTIDNTISVKRQINDYLEAIARQLYDYWFVQFDFPDENGKPYKSSGGQMVWNEKLKREIPEGWEVCSIGDIIDKYPSTRRYDTDEYLADGNYPIIDQDDKYIVGFTNETDGLLNRLPAVVFGDHSTRVKYVERPFARGADGTQILYSKYPNVGPRFLFLCVSAMQIPNPGYSRHFKYLKDLLLCVPNQDVSTRFEEIVRPIFKQWSDGIFQNDGLRKHEEYLLPLLMNRQVSVRPLNNHLSHD